MLEAFAGRHTWWGKQCSSDEGGKRPGIGQYGGRIHWVKWEEVVSLVEVYMGVVAWPIPGQKIWWFQYAALFISIRTGTWADDSKIFFFLFAVLYHEPQSVM